MRALILPDRDFLAREHALLRVLEVGLADEGYHVFHGVPATIHLAPQDAGADAPGVFSTPITYADSGLPLTLAWRARALVNRVEEAVVGEPAPASLAGVGAGTMRAPAPAGPILDVVHVFGEQAGPLGVQIARQTGARLVVEVFDAAGVPSAARLLASAAASPRPVGVVGDEHLERLLKAVPSRASRSPATICLAPWGVHVPATAHDWRASASSRCPSVALAGTGRDGTAVLAALEGLALVARVLPDLIILADAGLVHRAGVWRMAERLGLQHQLSVLPALEARRDLVLEADMLVVPEADGRQRTLLLDAMARGMLVVARADPAVACLRADETARLVQGDRGAGAPSATAWSSALLGLWQNPGTAASLAASARAYVKSSRLASGYVRALLEAYGGR